MSGVLINHGSVQALDYVWSVADLDWVPMTQPGGSTTLADFGDPFPSTGIAVGFESAGGLMVPLVLEADGSVPVTVVGGASGGDVNLVEVGGAAIALGQAAMAAALPVVIASDQSAVPVSGTLTVIEEGSATATLANVAASASSVTLLAANADRKQAVIVNDSSDAVLYVKYGVTASATSYTFQVQPTQTLILPLPIYTGRIDGIWDSASGAARVTEY